MDESESLKKPPPSYVESASTSTLPDPPDYSLIPTLIIGSRQTTVPLISIEHLKGHLALLRAFYRLRAIVEAGKDTRLPEWSRNVNPEKRWVWFVGLAVERFERWCRSLFTISTLPPKECLPPIDVVMCWHAYLLNPSWFAEDIARIPVLRSLGALDKVLFAYLSPESVRRLVTSPPSHTRRQFWLRHTDTDFDPLVASRNLLHKRVNCPRCRNPCHVPFIDDHGTGYSQSSFEFTCPYTSCKFSITKDSLAAKKFVSVLCIDEKYMQSYFAGSLFSLNTMFDQKRALQIREVIMGCPAFSKYKGLSPIEMQTKILTDVNFSTHNLWSHVSSTMRRGSGKLLNRIKSAYTDDRIFSIDLIGAVVRQGSFVKKMHDLGWTKDDFFESSEEEVVLRHCLARYHAFLDLLSSSPTSFFVPTLDIDLVWHSHQLRYKRYKEQCLRYVGRFIDHDDKVEENLLSVSFDTTCRAWAGRFHVPYIYCGCPLPEGTVSQNTTRTPSFLQLPLTNEPAKSATHPSDHNAVFLFKQRTNSEMARERRQAHTAARRKRDARVTNQGTSRDGSLGEVGVVHDSAFLYPIPLVYPTGPLSDCAALNGHMLVSGCAVGVGLFESGGGGAGCGGGCGGGG